MKRPGLISRRAVLRGAGVSVALPWLEGMASAADVAGRAAATAARAGAGQTSPLRMAFFYVPNGVHMPAWTPPKEGADFPLPETLRPLQPFQKDLLVLTGLAQDNAEAHGDGGGDHARSLACFLTGVHPLKTDGANIRVGVSVDQVAAEQVGKRTRFPSLELGCDRGAQSGNCDSGYSCAYSSNIAWRSPNTPVAKEVNPRLVFDRLFAAQARAGTAADRSRRDLYRRSILDFVAEDATQLRGRLGVNDKRKLDEYLTSVREVELRVARAGAGSVAQGDLPRGFRKPSGIPDDAREHIRLMADLLALAFQGDLTRIATFMFANEGSNKSYAFIGVPEGHHDLSHHGGDKAKQEKIRKINLFHMEQFAYFVGRLKAIPEGDGTLLDHSMIVYGSGISDGDRHNHNDLPILLAGRAGGSLKTGRHLRYSDRTPLNNLYLSMIERMGVNMDKLGDSKGRLPRLDG